MVRFLGSYQGNIATCLLGGELLGGERGVTWHLGRQYHKGPAGRQSSWESLEPARTQSSWASWQPQQPQQWELSFWVAALPAVQWHDQLATGSLPLSQNSCGLANLHAPNKFKIDVFARWYLSEFLFQFGRGFHEIPIEPI